MVSKVVKPVYALPLSCACLMLILTLSCSTSYAQSDIARCKGHGYVGFTGEGTLLISGDGVLIVNQEADIIFSQELAGESNTDLYTEPECMPSDDGKCIYIMNDDRAWISGEEIDASFAGANIGLTASGNATLFIKGYGMYRVGKLLGRWSIEGTTIALDNE